MEAKAIIYCDGGHTNETCDFSCEQCGFISHSEYTFQVKTFLSTVQPKSYFYLCKNCHAKKLSSGWRHT